ncbi:dihydroorotate dehydrogenase [Cytobacillus depressus]|uniref:Dihydroorotate dehydrogenase n=1 Tax=Cytobacillus depressus TaxID=1602942 RepID=A0A6L3V6K3_9BACI|nr:dihydroorotate dehydrogenase [Cytobacillus depressus]KAB2337074.1 dihydroorotate dehydrogenase [Cytobacillus depressus]
MPDWSYHPLFKQWINRLPNAAGREFIHRGMNLIAGVPGGKRIIDFLGHMEPSKALSKNYFNSTFISPIGLSGKIDPNISGTKAFSHLGFGFIEIGPVSLFPSAADKHAHFDLRTESICFPKPLASIGLEQTLQKLNKQNLDTPLFIRLSLNPSEKMNDLLKLAKSLRPFAAAFVIEWSGGNHNLEFIEHFAKESEMPLVLAIAHNTVKAVLPHLQLLVSINAIHGIIIEEADGNLDQYQQTSGIADALMLSMKNGIHSIPVITSGGVYEPEDALLFHELGADLIMLSGGYVSTGPGLPKRINEALADELINEKEIKEIQGWKWYWLFGLIILCGGFLALFFSMTRVILPYDERFIQMTRDELIALNPNIIKFMAHDRMTLAGTMISGAIIYMQLAKHGVRFGLHWTRKAFNIAAISGFLGILLFIGYGYFDWLHGLFWLILLPFFLWGVFTTKKAIHSPRSKNRKNTRSWKKSLWGQLCFVVLGFSFVIGGIVISTIGATSIFVPTDIGFICLPPEILHEINNRLIPVIAHDRAGFGSALFSVGLLVLMVALWGFNQGAKWVWHTFLLGGIPAFLAGILTHFFIGYTTFIHLLPAYFALLLYVAGLVLSREFLLNMQK